MKKILLLIAAILLLLSSVSASDLNARGRELEEALPDTSREMMESYTFGDTGSFGEAALSIFKKAWEMSKTHFMTSARNVALIVAIVLLSATLGSIWQDAPQKAVVLCGAAAILLLSAGEMKGFLHSSAETISHVHTFSKLLMPVMSGACFSSGLPTASAALYAGSMLFMQVLLSLMEKLLLPLVYAFIALAGADAALDGDTLDRFKKFIGSTIKNSLKVVMILFSAYLTLTGLISGKADAIALKAAKLTVSSTVPVVGGMVSDATETVLVGAKLLLNSAGIFGMLGALSILVLPFLKIGTQYLMLQMGAAISSLIGLKSHVKLIDSLSAAMGYLLAITSCSTLMIFISCFCFMRVSGT